MRARGRERIGLYSLMHYALPLDTRLLSFEGRRRDMREKSDGFSRKRDMLAGEFLDALLCYRIFLIYCGKM